MLRIILVCDIFSLKHKNKCFLNSCWSKSKILFQLKNINLLDFLYNQNKLNPNLNVTALEFFVILNN